MNRIFIKICLYLALFIFVYSLLLTYYKYVIKKDYYRFNSEQESSIEIQTITEQEQINQL